MYTQKRRFIFYIRLNELELWKRDSSPLMHQFEGIRATNGLASGSNLRQRAEQIRTFSEFEYCIERFSHCKHELFAVHRRVLKYEVQDRAFFAYFRTRVIENRADATAEIQHGCYVDVVLVVCFRVLLKLNAEPVLLVLEFFQFLVVDVLGNPPAPF